MFKRILFPTDGSELTAKALKTALQLAQLTGAGLSALSVKEPFPYSAISELQPVPPRDYYDKQQRIADERIEAVSDAAAAAGVACEGHTVEALHPWEAILAHADARHCDLIVMASKGRHGMQALLLGSESQKVLTHGTLPILIVK